MSTEARTRRTRILGVAGAVLLVAGVIAIVVAARAQTSAPQPPPAAASPVNVIPTASSTGSAGTVPGPTGTPPKTASGPHTRGLILAHSIPIRLRIPAINVNSTLKKIGLTSSGQIATPPLVKDSHAYWLTVSPTPGQLGPATIIGHVDSAAYGSGVFFKLGDMRQRDKIYLTRSDGTIAMFEVERVAEYSKAHFPTREVYGNIDHAGLRLITCGGTFNSAIHSYESNIVVYAALVSAHHA
jgi:sortase (surface protein transpeptidase)